MSANEHMVTELRCALSKACELLELARCPDTNCKDGAIPHQIGDNEWEAEQCQWCHEKGVLVKEHG